MSLRQHRKPEARNKQPDFVRKAGPHVKKQRHEPAVCSICWGKGFPPDYPSMLCWGCDGAGER